jgi:hypothetical protein
MTAQSMTAELTRADAALAVDLSFAATIDRALVHRASVAEVFVTDVRPVETGRFVAAAQLPLSHGYYSDHTTAPGRYDPLLVLEAGRQAGIAGAHLLGLPAPIIMLVKTFALRIDRPGAMVVGRLPGELRIDNRFEAVKTTAGRVRTGLVRQRLFLRGRPLGSHTMEVQVLSVREHELLRAALRGSGAPLTSDLPDGADPRQASGGTVGRLSALNVVLSDLSRGPGSVTAAVTPRFGNRALFDHDYDHLPAMTLSEAARQLALVAAGDDTGPARMQVVGVTGTFHKYAELDAPLRAQARTETTAAGETSTQVTFTQAGVPVAESAVVLAPLSAAQNAIGAQP